MAQVITIAGERLFALKAQNNEQLDIDTFIFANVPGQDPNATIDRNESVPPVGQQVHQQIVQQVGRVNDNVVIYSTVLDSLTGPFDFNWVGLYSSVNQTLIAVSHIPSVSKTITVPGAAGNTLNRNFGIEYSGIADLTGITVAPETWQLDFTARLNGMDELTRQLAADMNGKNWFIEDGFKVVPRSTLNSFKVTAGAGYVSGLRVELDEDHILTLQSYPQFIYVDAWFDGDASSQWKPKTAFTVTNGEMDDYIDVNGKQHYVFKLARITAADLVEDLRNIEGVSQRIDEIKKLADKSPSSMLFSDAVGLNTTALPVSLEKNKAGASQDRWVLLFGDSHGWGQGAPDWDKFIGTSNYSVHSAFPHNNGFMSKIAEHIRGKLKIKENVYSLGNPQSRNPITSLDWRRGESVDITGHCPLEVVLGHIRSDTKNLTDITPDTLTQFFAPVARQDVDSYSLFAYREKAASSLFNNSMMTLNLENISRFSTQGKDYKVQLPSNPLWEGSDEQFTKIKDSRGSIIAEYNNTSGEFYLITMPGISYPEWFKVDALIYFHGSGEAHKIHKFLLNGAILIKKANGSEIGASLAHKITDNYTIYHGEYLFNVLLRATVRTPSRATYVHVRHHEKGGILNISWIDAISSGTQLTPFLNTGAKFRNSANPFQPVFNGGNHK